MDSVDTAVIGAGVVGLAVARALAQAGREVVILEATEAFGSATSARNSEVIHAGLYYPVGSLKAQCCVQGRELLYAYCEAKGVAHRRVGKLLVATHADEEPTLHALVQRAAACGSQGLQWLTRQDAIAMEPALQCTAAVWSPHTGIVDSHGLMLALLGDAEAAGAMLALQSPVRLVHVVEHGFELEVGGEQPMQLACRTLVNSAGLHAQAVARRMQGLAAEHVPPQHWARGHYFTCAGRPAFSRLIYPMPGSDGLGIHVTLDLAGQMRFGPDVQWVPTTALGEEDYRVDPALAPRFAQSIRRYWPGLPEGALQASYAGLRPKVHAPGEPAHDFIVSTPAHHGVPGLVNLFGIESPGLTSCLALADKVKEALG